MCIAFRAARALSATRVTNPLLQRIHTLVPKSNRFKTPYNRKLLTRIPMFRPQLQLAPIKEAPSTDEALSELAAVLKSPGFATSKRRSKFLSYIVERTLEGRADELKELTIALDVFGRPPSFDQRLDSVVRVHASHVRSKLREYYAESGRASPITIILPPGSYIPSIAFRKLRGDFEDTPCNQDDVTGTVAVLPCVNMSGDPDQQAFCDGLTEELIHELAQRPEVRVVARTSVFQFQGKRVDIREVGNMLGADAALETSCRHNGLRMRVIARLTNTHTGLTLLSQEFDEELGDILLFQQRAAAAIVGALRIEPSGPTVIAGARRAVDPACYDAYLRARSHLSKRTEQSLRIAIESFQPILDLYPDFAPAYSGLAHCYVEVGIWHMGAIRLALDRAAELSNKAIEMEETLPEPHATLAMVHICRDRNWLEAERQLRRAIQLAPSYSAARTALGLFGLIPIGRTAEAIEHLKAGLRQDPLSLLSNNVLAMGYYYSGRYDEALEQANRTLAVAPEFDRARAVKAAILIQQGAFEQAADAFRAEALEGGVGASMCRNYALLAHIERRLDRPDRAAAYVAALQKADCSTSTSEFWIAVAELAINARDKALERLRNAVSTLDPWVLFLEREPLLEPLREDRNYLQLLQDLHLSS